MKIIEALKKIKDNHVKIEDLKKKISTYCADQSHETPMYGDKQRDTVRGWLQSINDLTQEILKLRIAIQKTNLATSVTMELGGKTVTKTIAEWVHRRRDLAEIDRSAWGVLSDRNLREGTVTTSTGEKMEVKIRRYYDPAERDTKVELYRSEPGVIDRTLEISNAVTDLIE